MTTLRPLELEHPDGVAHRITLSPVEDGGTHVAALELEGDTFSEAGFTITEGLTLAEVLAVNAWTSALIDPTTARARAGDVVVVNLPRRTPVEALDRARAELARVTQDTGVVFAVIAGAESVTTAAPGQTA